MDETRTERAELALDKLDARFDRIDATLTQLLQSVARIDGHLTGFTGFGRAREASPATPPATTEA